MYMSTLSDRWGDAEFELVDPEPDEVLRMLGIDPADEPADIQAGVVEHWDILSEDERELLSEAGYV